MIYIIHTLKNNMCELCKFFAAFCNKRRYAEFIFDLGLASLFRVGNRPAKNRALPF